MAGYMVTLSAGCATVLPFASKTQVVGTLPSDVVIAKVIIEALRIKERLGAVYPETLVAWRRLC